jgi:heat shock protein HslJ
MMKTILSMILMAFVTLSCTSTLYLAPKQVDCSGVSEQQCYLIRNSAEGNWIMHYQPIQGLDYEPGFSYKLKVKKQNIKNPPMDGSTFSYQLVEVLNKEDVATNLAKEDLVTKVWKLEYLRWEGTRYGVDGETPTITFEEDGKVGGSGGCNRYFSNYTLEGRTIRLQEIGSTKKVCPDNSELENTFFQFLGIETRAIFSDGKLIMSSDGGNRAVFNFR